MSQPFNKLSPAEVERLSLFIEECGEAIHAATKVLRHGWDSTNPFDGGREKPTNRQSLEKEIGHIDNAVSILSQADDIDAKRYMAASKAKRETIARWLHHNPQVSP